MSDLTPSDVSRVIGAAIRRLREEGFDPAADRLQEIQDTAYTTSSEWIGELGRALRRIAEECPVPPDLDADLDRLRAVVRKVFPAW